VVILFSQPSPVHGWTPAYLLDVRRLRVAIEGRLSYFLSRWLMWVGGVWLAKEKSLEILRRGWELNPGHGEDRQPRRGQTATERTDSEIHSFCHWAIMTRAMEGTDSEIPSFSYWAIITRATERTESEIPSFSHCATRAMERTESDIFILPLSYWYLLSS